MSKQKFKSLRKNESYDDDYEMEDRRQMKDKRKERRFERALRTKNINDLVDEDYEEYDEPQQVWSR
jgi:hypothetical protein